MFFGAEQGRDGVAIEGIRFDTRIGVTQAERQMFQRVIVSLFFERELALAGTTDELRHTVDYRAVADVVMSIGAASRVKLIETLAWAIGSGLLEKFRDIHAVRVMLRKPGTPGNVEAVGVFISVRRDALEAAGSRRARPSGKRRAASG